MSKMHDRSFQFERFRRLGSRADSWALSSESTIAKDLFAAAASRGRRSFADLRRDVENGHLSGWDTSWVARLARILSLQPFETDLHGFAFQALELACAADNCAKVPFQTRKTLFELLFARGEFESALGMLEEQPDLDDFYHGFFRADLTNPFLAEPMGTCESWLELFNRAFLENEVSGVTVDVNSVTPFDGLKGTVSAGSATGPLVTVIITTYNPNPVELRTSVLSILNQTWRNIEVLLIDDCSGDESTAILDELSSMDSRIRLIRLPVNGGTYRARNVGIDAATGKYLTGQDTDDWSHPERIERQVAVLESDPASCGVTVSANRTDDRLIKVALGHNPERRCEVSLMVRSSVASEVGGYLPVRKAADSEFRERIEAWTDRPVERIEAPLYMIRMSPGSLSRADFRPGWSHHARRAFWSGYKYWHSQVKRSELPQLTGGQYETISKIAPQRIAGREWSTARTLDVCIVADWRGTTVELRAAFDELRALASSGLRVSVLHLDTPWGQTGDPRALHPDVQELINDGKVQRVFLDEDVQVDLVVVRDPSATDYAREIRSSIRCRYLLMVAHGDPKRYLTHLSPYDLLHAHGMAESIFGVQPRWVSTAGFAPNVLSDNWGVPVVAERYPIYIDTNRFSKTRIRRGIGRPVVGRTAENEVEEWPSRRLLPLVYPTDGQIDFRVLGDARGAVRTMRQKQVPIEWLQYKDGDLEVDKFWRTVDALVLFDQDRGAGGLERSVLEALSAGVLVIAGKQRAEVYGDAIQVSEPSDVMQTLWSVLNDSEELGRRREKGYELVRKHNNPSSIQRFINRCFNDAITGIERNG